MPKFVDLIGQIFGRLTVIKKTNNKDNKSMWICLCSCGNRVFVNSGHLLSGNTKSCGCLNKENKFKHGHAQGGKESRTHRIWKNMLSRCNNPNSLYYEYYGGRGITVCCRWSNKNQKGVGFKNFLKDMGECPGDKHQIDRKNNSKGYFKKNCRWVLSKGNNRNRRNNILIPLDEKLCLLIELAEKYGINKYTLKYRLAAGWPTKDALMTPARKYKKRKRK